MKKKEIGQAIKKARENAKMTQEAVAALFGENRLKSQAVNNWETGISFPRPERWAILEKGLNLPPGWFLELRTGAAPVVQVNGPVNGPLVAGVLQPADPEPVPPRGDIARDLCNMIVSRLEGMDIEGQIALRARVKAALDEPGTRGEK